MISLVLVFIFLYVYCRVNQISVHLKENSQLFPTPADKADAM